MDVVTKDVALNACSPLSFFQPTLPVLSGYSPGILVLAFRWNHGMRAVPFPLSFIQGFFDVAPFSAPLPIATKESYCLTKEAIV